MLFGIFHKPSASSLSFVSGILPCLGESSSRPLFPVPSAGTETSTTTPARTSQRCQPLLLPLFHSVRQSPTASAPPTSFFFSLCLRKNVWVPLLISRGYATVYELRRYAAPTPIASGRPGYSRGSRSSRPTPCGADIFQTFCQLLPEAEAPPLAGHFYISPSYHTRYLPLSQLTFNG